VLLVSLSCATAAITGCLWLAGWLPAVERVTDDLLLRTTAPSDASASPVVAVLIDDASVRRYGQPPWPRSLLARLLEKVSAGGAHGIALDVLLSDPREASGDAVLAHAISMRPTRVAAALDREGSWLLPLEIFGGVDVAAHAYGEVGPDGVVRTLAATKQAHGVALPALAVAGARILHPELAVAVGSELRPAFRPAPQDLSAWSAADVLESRIPTGALRDRLVFIGVSATGAGDQFVVPTGPRHQPVAGVLAHASAAASIVGDRLVRKFSAAATAVAVLVLAAAVQVLRDRKGAFELGTFLALLGAVVLFAVLAARYALVLLPVATCTTALVASALLRETSESHLARREVDRLLASVLDHLGVEPRLPRPRNSRSRLAALQHLQQRVHEGDALRRTLLDGMDEGVVLWATDGAILEANPAARRLWGGEPTLDVLAESMPLDDGHAVIERDRRELLVRLKALPSGRLGLLQDVTAERALERQRREMQRLVSHELKTPLASIAGLGESLQRYRMSEDELARVAGLVRGEAARLQEMVSTFLDLERLVAGQWDEELITIDLCELVTARLTILAAAAETRKVSLSSTLVENCRVRGVPMLLERAVDNLVGNAIAYTTSGDTIEVDLACSGDLATLEIRDHGPGIPVEARSKIFDRFYRIRGSGRSGSGLGLALVKEVVTWHGGCIRLDSTNGPGSTFRITLPVAPEG
jgi:signal transduction histidine kinase/CHASE2 domain-containing sensor protein